MAGHSIPRLDIVCELSVLVFCFASKGTTAEKCAQLDAGSIMVRSRSVPGPLSRSENHFFVLSGLAFIYIFRFDFLPL